MRSFTYTQLPGRVVFGVGALDHLPREIELLGATRALVLSTPEQEAQAADVAKRLGDALRRRVSPCRHACADRGCARRARGSQAPGS